MQINPFKLERYFARYEFTAPFLLSCSDCEPMSLNEILSHSDAETRTLWDELKLGYTESPGLPLLRAEVASLYRTMQPENVLISAPEEGIFLAMNSILRKGDHVVVTFPGYQSLYEIALSLGCSVSQWIPKEENGWFFDPDELNVLIRPETKLIVINFPHNPTGAILQDSDLKQIVAIAENRNIILFSDEMYRFLEYEASCRPESACDLSPNAISLGGMSKSFALAGLRLGWITSHNREILGKIGQFKDYTTICSSAPSEILSLIALRAKKEILARNLSIIDTNLQILDTFFSEFGAFFAWYRPKAGPIAFPRFKGKQGTESFCRDLIEKKGVMLLPSNQYDYGDSHFRLGFARRNMPKALSQLKDYIRHRLC